MKVETCKYCTEEIMFDYEERRRIMDKSRGTAYFHLACYDRIEEWSDKLMDLLPYKDPKQRRYRVR